MSDIETIVRCIQTAIASGDEKTANSLRKMLTSFSPSSSPSKTHQKKHKDSTDASSASKSIVPSDKSDKSKKFHKSHKTENSDKNPSFTFNVGSFFSLNSVLVSFNFLNSGTTIDDTWFGIKMKFVNKHNQQDVLVIIRQCDSKGCLRHIVSFDEDTSPCHKCKKGSEPQTEKQNTFVPNAWMASCEDNNHQNYIDRSLLNIPFGIEVFCGCGSALTKTERDGPKMKFHNVKMIKE
jgi:hypothetical protein